MTLISENLIELIVFDWDGTLMDSTAAISESIRLAAADMGLPVPTIASANHVIGLGLADALAHAVPTLRKHDIAAFSARYRHHYMIRAQQLQAFDGAADLLATLNRAGVPVAIATGKGRQGLNSALAAVGWNHHFVTSRCADEGNPKPHPWMLLDICAELTVAPARTVMIGDTTHDLTMARSAGARAVAVSYGAHPIDQLNQCQPDVICGSIEQLRRWLLARLSTVQQQAAS